MITTLRIKGRILLVSNVGLMSLVFATGLMLILCINFGVLFYELFLRKDIEGAASFFMPLADLFVSLLLLTLSACVYWQIRLGADRFFLRKGQKNGGYSTDIFYYFRPQKALSAVIFSFRLTLLKTVYFVVSFFPSGFCLWLLLFLAEKGVSSLVGMVLAVGAAAFFLSGASLYRGLTSSLFLAKYHFIAADCISFRQLVSLSRENMKNNRKTLFRLKISFIGWFLLCFLIFPIGYVWSYYNQTLAVAAAEFIDR